MEFNKKILFGCSFILSILLMAGMWIEVVRETVIFQVLFGICGRLNPHFRSSILLPFLYIWGLFWVISFVFVSVIYCIFSYTQELFEKYKKMKKRESSGRNQM